MMAVTLVDGGAKNVRLGDARVLIMINKLRKCLPFFFALSFVLATLVRSDRFSDPLVGDRIEVSWEGRFRLESLDVFMGRSWWEATVVQKAAGNRCD